MEALINSANNQLTIIGGALITAAIVVVGIICIFSGSIRPVFSRAGAVALGAILIGGAVAFAGALQNLAGQL